MTIPRLSVLGAFPLTGKVRSMASRLRQKIAPKAQNAFSVDTLDLTAPVVAQNPFPYYQELRRLGPVHFLPHHGFWFVLGFHQVSEALMNPQLFSSRVPEWLAVDNVILGADPPDHTAVRRLIAPHFYAEVLEAQTQFAGQVAERLVEPLIAGKPIEVLRDFGFPLSEGVAAHLIGFDHQLLAQIRALQKETMRNLGEWLNGLDSIIADASERIPLYATLLRESQGSLDHRDIRCLIRFLWIAGTTTTRRVIASSVLMLLRHPELSSRIKSDASLLASFVEESIRLYPPEHSIARITTEETELSGVRIPAGAVVKLCLAAANRDPDCFEEPLVIRLDRSPNRQLSFGGGIHRCVGAPLARIEVVAALRVLLQLAPGCHSVYPIGILAEAGFIHDTEELLIEC